MQQTVEADVVKSNLLMSQAAAGTLIRSFVRRLKQQSAGLCTAISSGSVVLDLSCNPFCNAKLRLEFV